MAQQRTIPLKHMSVKQLNNHQDKLSQDSRHIRSRMDRISIAEIVVWPNGISCDGGKYQYMTTVEHSWINRCLSIERSFR